MDFREFLRQGFVVLDGATGSNLQQAGMESGDCPEQWIAKHPEVFIDLQCRYIEVLMSFIHRHLPVIELN